MYGMGKGKVMKKELEKYFLGLPNKVICPHCIKCEKTLNELNNLHILHNSFKNMHMAICDNCYKKYNVSQ